METGICKFFNAEKGFGFITPDDGGDDVFVHSSGLKENINEGDKVTYELEQGDRGPKALNVTLR